MAQWREQDLQKVFKNLLKKFFKKNFFEVLFELQKELHIVLWDRFSRSKRM
jgi:hypothetical protein